MNGNVDEERESTGFILVHHLFLRLRSKGVMNELGAGRTVESFTRKPLDKYQSLSIAFRKRHGLGLSKDEVEGKALFMNWENGKNESNDEKEDEYDDSEVWWEDQIHKKGGRRNVARFPIRLGSVLKRRRRQWMKSSSSSLDDDSGLESEEEEEEAQDASMENSFDGSSDDLESEERIACDDDSTTVPTYLQEYKYQNEEEWKGIEDDRPYDPLNGDNEWGLFEETDDVHYRNLEDENEQWEDHHQCDFEEQQDWSDDNDPVMTSVTPAVEQWGCKDPSEGVHQYGGGIHDQSNRKFRKKYGNGDGEFAEDESEGVWDGNDEDEWMFGNSLEDNKSEEEESFVGYDDDSEEEQSNYENSDDDEHHNSGMSSYSHEEEEI